MISRFYVAGELGSMWGPIYQGACNNAEAMVSAELPVPMLQQKNLGANHL